MDTSFFVFKVSKVRPPYPAEFRQQMVELVRAGRSPAQLSREFALANLERALASVGARAADVVRLGIYIKNYRREQSAVVAEALHRVFPKEKMPASTWLGVETLAIDELLIEIEATAVTELKAPL